jgi:cytochrome P450
MDALVKQLKSEAASNYSVKFINHIHHAIFCLLVFMCFGEKVDSEKIEVIKHVQRLWIISSGKFGVLNYFPKAISHMLFRKRWNELLHLQKDQKDVFMELIRAREKEKNKNNINDESFICYVDTLLNIQLPEEKRKLDDDELVALCSEFLTAGTDTTSSALEWVMANLVKYGHVQQRIVEEIREVVAHREEREVKEEDLEKLPYLKAVILEGLRRHPPSHYLIPHAVTEDVIFNGYLVPKNGTINFMVAEVGWDPTAWEDPMAFKPERFEESSSGFDVTSQTEIKMMPFGAGRRICPAYHLAMLHLEFFMANLVWNFEWKTLSPESNVDLSEKQEFTMVMKHPLEAQISPRN